MTFDAKQTLLDKLNNHSATVAITSLRQCSVQATRLSTRVGLGYVGLLLRRCSGQALAVAFAEAGFPVIGIDVDPTKVDAINAGHSCISDSTLR